MISWEANDQIQRIIIIVLKTICCTLHFQPYLMGVIVPDEEVMAAWAKDNGENGNFKELCSKQVSTNIYYIPSSEILEFPSVINFDNYH